MVGWEWECYSFNNGQEGLIEVVASEQRSEDVRERDQRAIGVIRKCTKVLNVERMLVHASISEIIQRPLTGQQCIPILQMEQLRLRSLAYKCSELDINPDLIWQPRLHEYVDSSD